MFHFPEKHRIDNDIDVFRMGRIILSHHQDEDAEYIMLTKWGKNKLSIVDIDRVREGFDKHDIAFQVQGKHTLELHRLKYHSPN